MSYKTPSEFNDLYYDFTGYQHDGYPKDRTAIAQDLAKAFNASGMGEGPVVIASGTGIYAYDSAEGHKLLGGASFRAMPNSGFYEITSVSHVGPSIAYLGTIQDLGQDSWKDHIKPLLDHVRAVREVNAQSDNWVKELALPAWKGRDEQITKLVDYACALAGHYLVRIRDDESLMSPADVKANFLKSSSSDFPIGYDTVMIGTFALAALKSAYEIYAALSAASIDWKNAKVLLHNQAGTNYTAGLTAGTNWVYPTVQAIAGKDLSTDRIMIVPYATLPDSVGKDSLPDKDFSFLADSVWGQLYSRPQIAKRAFSDVADIFVPGRPAIPGDYGLTSADDIDSFVMRLKYSTSDVAQMQSNSLGFWMGGEAVDKGWKVESFDMPGLTHGLPDGLDAYPSAPEIPE